MVRTELDDSELAAVLAGLRLLQKHLEDGPSLPDGIQDILTNGGTLTSLAPEDIDELCLRMNR